MNSFIFLCEKLKAVYLLKEKYREFNKTTMVENVTEQLDLLINEFIYFDDKGYRCFGRLSLIWRDEIINSFNRVNNYRISNGKMERANRDIKTIFRLSKDKTIKFNGKSRGHYKK